MTTRATFSSCCAELASAIHEAPNSLLHVGDNGVLYLSVGYELMEDGPEWLDQAVMFCPFCGAKLQSTDGILRGGQAGC